MTRLGRSRRLAIVGAAVLVAALAVAAWAATRQAVVGTTIDGFPVGDAISCDAAQQDAAQQCQDWIRLAQAALDQRDPGHAAVVSATVHGEDFGNTTVYPDQSVLRSRGVGFGIVVFKLADGSERAAGVYCPPNGCVGTPTYPH